MRNYRVELEGDFGSVLFKEGLEFVWSGKY